MKNSIVFILCLSMLAFVACSDDSGTPPKRNNDNNANNVNNLNNINNVDPDMGEDGGEEDMLVEPGRLDISTNLLTFEGVRMNETATQSVVITNNGGSDLLIIEATLGEIDRMGTSEFQPGPNWVNEATLIEPGTFIELDIVYAPSDFETDRGTLTIETSDPDNQIFEVRIETTSAYRDVDAPQFFRFGFVEADTTETQRILVFNRGGEPLTIDDIAYSGLGLFSLDFSANTNFPNFPTTEAILQPNEAFAVDVVYSPTDTEPDRGTITITSNDPDEATFEIALAGNQSGECLRATPRVVDFGQLPAGQASSQTITLFNCSNAVDLEIASIEVTDDGGEVFSIETPPATPLTLDTFGMTTFDVTAQLQEGERVGSVTVTTGGGEPRALELRAKAEE